MDSQVHRLFDDLVTVSAGFAVSDIVADHVEPGPSGRMLGWSACARQRDGIEGCRNVSLTLAPHREFPGTRGHAGLCEVDWLGLRSCFQGCNGYRPWWSNTSVQREGAVAEQKASL